MLKRLLASALVLVILLTILTPTYAATPLTTIEAHHSDDHTADFTYEVSGVIESSTIWVVEESTLSSGITSVTGQEMPIHTVTLGKHVVFWPETAHRIVTPLTPNTDREDELSILPVAIDNAYLSITHHIPSTELADGKQFPVAIAESHITFLQVGYYLIYPSPRDPQITTHASTENWDGYLSSYTDQPGTIVLHIIS